MRLRHPLARLEHYLNTLEAWIAAGGLLLMLALALTEIVARNLFETGFPVAETLLRYLVLLVTFMGAVLAVREERHIRLDLVLTWISASRRGWLLRVFNVLTAVVCATFAWAAVRFLRVEWEMAQAGHEWTAALAAILPIGFGLIALHAVLAALLGPPSEERK